MKVYIVEDDYKFIRPLPIQLNKDGKPKKKQKEYKIEDFKKYKSKKEDDAYDMTNIKDKTVITQIWSIMSEDDVIVTL